MTTLQTLLRSSLKQKTRVLCTRFQAMCTKASESSKAASQEPATPSQAASQSTSFTYISAATPPPPTQPVGPGADKAGTYPNTEYYTYNKMSYFDLEVEMTPHRVPQPAADNGHF